jgi:hypothetical protein
MRNETRPIARRQALKCMAWAGAGVAWAVVGGVPRSVLVGSAKAAEMTAGAFHFVQISDNHFGFGKEANPDALGTAKEAIAKINAMPTPPSLILHTGDITHLSKPVEFDIAQQTLGELRTKDIFFTPGEHDVLDQDPGSLYRERFAKGSKGDGWYSFDQGGVHFVALVNVMSFAAGNAKIGADQLDWLAADLKSRSASTPIVVFAHIPLWPIYPDWGWNTVDSELALAELKRFGSVTVLNGHIHQVLQKVEGNVAFHTAMSTAYPQPRPGEAPSPGPLKVPADQLRRLLGVRSIDVVPGKTALAVVDTTLADA